LLLQEIQTTLYECHHFLKLKTIKNNFRTISENKQQLYSVHKGIT